MKPDADAGSLRRMVYALLITLAAGSVAGRILAVARLSVPYLYQVGHDPNDPRSTWPAVRPEPVPTLGDNDRSRWDTVRALVDNGTYAIGHRDVDPQTDKYHDKGIITEDGWKTIDKVLLKTQDFASSKPPFLATLVAGEYWLLKKAFGWSITDQRWYVVRTILLTINWLPFILYLVILSRLVDRLGATDWGRFYVVAAACFATLVTPFAITLNNHSIATFTALFALYSADRIWYGPGVTSWWFVLAGFFAGFTACCELPAAAFLAALFVLLVWRFPARTLMAYLPAAAVPIGFFLLTNYLAIGQLRPAYSEFGGPMYQYEGSHWNPPAPGEQIRGIDWAGLKETKAEYAFNMLLGHHGIFSLSPIYLFTLVAVCLALFQGLRRATPQRLERETGPPLILLGLTLYLSVVVIGFYIVKSDNYGGWTTGLRWLMWLTPFWLLAMLPVVDWLAPRRWGRGLAYVFLAISVLSASYPAWTPWLHPWLYNWMNERGMIPY
jgi:hypothetical protein